MKKIVLVTNHLTPYRKSFYDQFFKICKDKNIQFTVLLMTKREPNRNWDYESLKVDYAILMKGKRFSIPVHSYLNLEVTSILKEIKPDIILMAGSYMYYTNWLVLSKKYSLKYPVIYWNEAHFNEKRSYGKTILKIRDIVRKTIFRKFDGFWFSGEMSKELITHYKNEKSKLYFLPNFIDNSVYSLGTKKTPSEIEQIKESLKLPKGNKVAIIPARLSKVKGIDLFIDLLLKSQNKNTLTILIPGTGPDKELIEQKIYESKLDIRLLGFVNQDVMIKLYAVTDLFILPSVSDPNPLTCIEALWCGLPLFVSNHVGNHPEVIDEGVNGYMFKYNEPTNAIRKLDKLLSSDGTWFDTARKKSIEIANEFYNPDIIIHKVIDKMVDDFTK